MRGIMITTIAGMVGIMTNIITITMTRMTGITIGAEHGHHAS
jgi:hypothetical protein